MDGRLNAKRRRATGLDDRNKERKMGREGIGWRQTDRQNVGRRKENRKQRVRAKSDVEREKKRKDRKFFFEDVVTKASIDSRVDANTRRTETEAETETDACKDDGVGTTAGQEESARARVVTMVGRWAYIVEDEDEDGDGEGALARREKEREREREEATKKQRWWRVKMMTMMRNRSDMIVMEHPTSLFRRPSLAIADVGIVIRRHALLRGAAQHADNTEADGGDGESGTPTVIQNVETDVAVGIHMRVARRRWQKYNLGRLHRIVGRKYKTKGVLFILIYTSSGARHCH